MKGEEPTEPTGPMFSAEVPDRYKAFDQEERGEVLVKEDKDSLEMKVRYHERRESLNLGVMSVFIVLWMLGTFILIAAEAPSYSYYLNGLLLICASYFSYCAVIHIYLGARLQKLIVYEKGIRFTKVDRKLGTYRVYLPWSELGKYRMKTDKRLGNYIHLPSHMVIILESMEGYERFGPFIRDHLRMDL